MNPYNPEQHPLPRMGITPEACHHRCQLLSTACEQLKMTVDLLHDEQCVNSALMGIIHEIDPKRTITHEQVMKRVLEFRAALAGKGDKPEGE